ncbi:MAG: hypothetical protein ACP5G2_02775 [Candidatus Bipolaricaulaceae bacterium]
MRTVLAAALLLLAAGPAGSVEVGVQLGWQEGTTAGHMWGTASGRVQPFTWSGRVEVELRPARLRVLFGKGELAGDGWSLTGEAKLLGTGRVDLGAGAALCAAGGDDGWETEGSAGVQGTWAAALSGGPLLVSAWAEGRWEAGPVWVDGRLTLPWGGPAQGQWGVGFSPGDWAALRATTTGLSLTSVSLELGGQAESLAVSTYLMVWPTNMQVASVRWGSEDTYLRGRVRLRGGEWKQSVTALVSQDGCTAAVEAEFARGWLQAATLDVQFELRD